MAHTDAYIGYERTEEEMKDRVCICPEASDVDFTTGDGSIKPCMHDANGLIGVEIHCSNCMYCVKREKTVPQITVLDMKTMDPVEIEEVPEPAEIGDAIVNYYWGDFVKIHGTSVGIEVVAEIARHFHELTKKGGIQ